MKLSNHTRRNQQGNLQYGINLKSSGHPDFHPFSCFNTNVFNPVLGTDDLELEESLRPSKGEIENDDERKIRLQRKLSDFHCVHLYESLDRIGFSADQVSSIDNTILEKINVPLPERERIIETITKEQMRLEAGNTFEI